MLELLGSETLLIAATAVGLALTGLAIVRDVRVVRDLRATSVISA